MEPFIQITNVLSVIAACGIISWLFVSNALLDVYEAVQRRSGILPDNPQQDVWNVIVLVAVAVLGFLVVWFFLEVAPATRTPRAMVWVGLIAGAFIALIHHVVWFHLDGSQVVVYSNGLHTAVGVPTTEGNSEASESQPEDEVAAEAPSSSEEDSP